MNPNSALRVLAMFNNSQLLNSFIYPVQECYVNWQNIFNKEYPSRNGIRAILSTSGFIIGPLLTQVAHWNWLTDISSSLCGAIPVLNTLPSAVGTGICSAYICGYFFSWSAKQITNLFNAAAEGNLNKYLMGSIEHYLTPAKAQEVTTLMNLAGFNINVPQVTEIFNNIACLAGLEQKNQLLITLINAIRNGDFQTVLDNAILLENQIELINKKINILQDPFSNKNLPPANIPLAITPGFNNAISSSPRETYLHHQQLKPAAIMFQYKKPDNRWLGSYRTLNEQPTITDTIAALNKHKQQLEKNRFMPKNLINTV